MNTFLTRERLLEIIVTGPDASGAEQNELARIVLAAMDSEPVAYLTERNPGVEGYGPARRIVDAKQYNPLSEEYWSTGAREKHSVTPLYRHAQQPVVPATLPCSVELKPGLIIGKGCKTETLLTALRRRADYNADIDTMTPEERAEYDASIKAFKAMLPQPAPVVRPAPECEHQWKFGGANKLQSQKQCIKCGRVELDAQQPIVPDESYQQLSDLYHAQEKRLFKIAQRIKGPAFDKYSHSPSQAIDVLEAAIFGENEACRAAMLQAQPCDDGEPTDDERIMAIEGIIPPISSGNSPVIGVDLAAGPDRSVEVRYVAPPGYVMVPKEPTDEMQSAGASAIRIETTALNKLWTGNAVFRAMLAAAPQEVGDA